MYSILVIDFTIAHSLLMKVYSSSIIKASEALLSNSVSLSFSHSDSSSSKQSEGTFGVLNKSKEIPKKVKFGGNKFF